MKTLSKEEIEKLIHCINALKKMKENDSSLKFSYPGLEYIIEEAEEVLKNNPEIIPFWYKLK